MFQSITTERRVIMLGVIVTSLVVATSLIAIRAWAIYRLTTEQAILQSQFDLMRADLTSKDAAISSRLEAIEQTLYANPSPPMTAVTATVVPPMPRRQSSVEQWMYNRDKELQDRVRALELWRLRMER